MQNKGTESMYCDTCQLSSNTGPSTFLAFALKNSKIHQYQACHPSLDLKKIKNGKAACLNEIQADIWEIPVTKALNYVPHCLILLPLKTWPNNPKSGQQAS